MGDRVSVVVAGGIVIGLKERGEGGCCWWSAMEDYGREAVVAGVNGDGGGFRWYWRDEGALGLWWLGIFQRRRRGEEQRLIVCWLCGGVRWSGGNSPDKKRKQ
ncbi:hypothetical protein HAX54_035323 [Datura stramonium]|uniref:Uncharacterized protein n=1 Tax=Datura stramonium TaxID=4076 RepID=A0ABS8VG07_DATST|nr:hypothetical protein [Datura stramonium]